ncbi:MAG: hypothetical protein AAFV53_19770 [Myxococcota bacterium]
MKIEPFEGGAPLRQGVSRRMTEEVELVESDGGCPGEKERKFHRQLGRGQRRS